MKKLVLLIFLAGASVAMADNNLLKNGDFSNGVTEWEGDCHSPDSVTLDPTSSFAPTSGVVIKLNHRDWTRVTQDFTGKMGQYLLTITYAASPDLKFSTTPDDYANVPGKLGFALQQFSSPPGQWVVIINDLGAMHYTYWKIVPKLDASGIQTLTLHVQLDSDDSKQKGFYLVFPPGSGVINLQGISLALQGTP